LRLNHIKLLHPEHLEFALQKDRTNTNTTQPVETAQHRKFCANRHSVKDLDGFPYLEHIQKIIDSASQPPPPLPRKEIFPCAAAQVIHFISEPWEHDAQDCLDTYLQHNPYNLFAWREEYKYIKRWNKKNGMKTFYNNVMKEEYTVLHFRIFNNRNGF
jgi:hypothetical protein